LETAHAWPANDELFRNIRNLYLTKAVGNSISGITKHRGLAARPCCCCRLSENTTSVERLQTDGIVCSPLLTSHVNYRRHFMQSLRYASDSSSGMNSD
jgi:hypothetical protein